MLSRRESMACASGSKGLRRASVSALSSSKLKSSSSLHDVASIGSAVQRLEQKEESRRSTVSNLRTLLEENQEGLAALHERMDNFEGAVGPELRTELEHMLSEVGALRAHATATAATVARMEEMHRESGLVKQEVGVVRGELIELQRAVREADMRAVQYVSTIASLQSSVGSADQRLNTLATSISESQARFTREVAEMRTEWHDGIELVVADLKQLHTTIMSAERETREIKEMQAQLAQRQQMQQQQQQSALEDVVRRLQNVMDRVELIEREASQRWGEYDRWKNDEDENIKGLEARVGSLYAIVDDMRRMLSGWESLFAVVSSLGGGAHDPSYISYNEPDDQPEPYSPPAPLAWPRAPPPSASVGPDGFGYSNFGSRPLPTQYMPTSISSNRIPKRTSIPPAMAPPVDDGGRVQLRSAAVASPPILVNPPSPPSPPSSSNSAATTPTVGGRTVSAADKNVLRQLRAAMRLQELQHDTSNTSFQHRPLACGSYSFSGDSAQAVQNTSSNPSQPIREHHDRLSERVEALRLGGKAQSQKDPSCGSSALERVQEWLASGKMTKGKS